MELDALGEHATARAQALLYKTATAIQPISRQLFEYHRAELILLWEESAKLLRLLFTRDSKRYQLDYCRVLHHHGSQLYQAGRWVEAIHVLQEAVRLRRQLYKADPASGRNCADLVSSLDLYSRCLKRLGRTDDAHTFTKEALALLHKLYEFALDGRRRTELIVFLRRCGILFRGNPNSHSSMAHEHEQMASGAHARRIEVRSAFSSASVICV